jgi:hypothetical protein
MKVLLLSAVVIFFVTEMQAQFKVDSQLRDRFELRDGYKKLAAIRSNPTALVSQRTRISFCYEIENLKIKVTPQDVRIWGDDMNVTLGGNNGNEASLDLFEGYFELKLSPWAWVSVGRQQLVYDNQSLLSNANWNQNGIATDAVVFKFNPKGWILHLAGSWNTQTENNNHYPSSRYKTLNFLWINRKVNDNLSLSFLHVASGVMETDTTSNINFRQTSGVFGAFKRERFDFWADAYYQFGKNQTGGKVGACMIDAEVSYNLNQLTLGVGYGYQSGNNKVGADIKTDNNFDYLYRSRHTYHGGMDYFSNFDTHTKRAGLVNSYFFFNYKASKSISIRNTGHYFQLAQTNPSTSADKNLGFENDLVLCFKFSDWGTLESGYAFFLPTESLKTIQGVPNHKFSQFFYLQLTLTPTLFKQEVQ